MKQETGIVGVMKMTNRDQGLGDVNEEGGINENFKKFKEKC